jgi:hypothetical protein
MATCRQELQKCTEKKSNEERPFLPHFLLRMWSNAFLSYNL